ncbi:MAG: glycosyltransferase family 4 protein [Patescibacteria group bacterium]
MSSFLISFLIATLITPLVIKIYRSRNWVDDPATEPHIKKTHRWPVPRGGGIVVFLAIVFPALFFLEIDKYLIAIVAGAVLLMIVGVIDDVLDIHPYIRMITGILAALIVIGSGVGIAYLSNPLTGGVIHLDQPQLAFEFLGKTRSIWLLADFFALLFILWNMNIINWAKGVDGQLPGFVSIAGVIIAILSLHFKDDPTSFNTSNLSLMVAGAYAGLLIWNWYPQKIMPGYGAGSLAGYFLSILAILSGAKVATTLMVLAIPTADGIFTIIRRLLAGKSPFWGDRGHLHHKLMDIYGWNQRQIASFYWATSLLMGGLSLVLNSWGKLIALFVSMSFVFGFLIWVKIKQTNELVTPKK